MSQNFVYVYRLLIVLSPKIYVYPIKSLRGTQLSKAVATENGFEYDRMKAHPNIS
jgi:uncharacterized protein YcbX